MILGPWNKTSLVTQSPLMRRDIWSIAILFCADDDDFLWWFVLMMLIFVMLTVQKSNLIGRLHVVAWETGLCSTHKSWVKLN